MKEKKINNHIKLEKQEKNKKTEKEISIRQDSLIMSFKVTSFQLSKNDPTDTPGGSFRRHVYSTRKHFDTEPKTRLFP